jgi:hypothetical protein
MNQRLVGKAFLRAWQSNLSSPARIGPSVSNERGAALPLRAISGRSKAASYLLSVFDPIADE